MEILFRADLLAWLAADPVLAAELNAIVEEAPSRISLPWLAISASASTDWSCKTNAGREVRVALELHHRGDLADAGAALISAIEKRIAEMPPAQDGYTIVTSQFLRGRAEQRGESRRAHLVEYRFRLLAD